MSHAGQRIAEIESEAERIETRVAGTRIVWRVWGDGEPVVLLHGDFGSWTHWALNVSDLAVRFRVMVPDMPGYGASDSPAEPWTPQSLARDLQAGLAQLLQPSCRYGLAGFSFGGIIAGHLASLEGARVDSLVLIGPGGLALPGGTPPPLLRMKRDMNAHEQAAVHRHNLGALMIADPDKVDDLAIHLQIENITRARIQAGSIPDGDTLLQVLPSVTAQITGIWGGSDSMTVPYIPQHEAVLRSLQPDLSFHTIAGAGHWVVYESAEVVNGLLTEIFAHTCN